MTKYIISERVAVLVDFTRTVEAKSKKQALEKFRSGDSDEFKPPEIGESIDSYNSAYDTDLLVERA